MAQILTPERILEIARASQYITGNTVAEQNCLKGGSLNNKLDVLIYMERKGIQYQFDKDPNNNTLRDTTNYLFSILGYKPQAISVIDNREQAPPSITQPSNQSVDVGEDATFSTVATSELPVTYQWFLDGSPISGATSASYTVTNAQLSQDGGEYTITVSNAAGSVSSLPATLTVSNVITGQAYWGDTYFYDQLLLGIDNVPYNLNFDITDGQAFVVNFPSGAALNKYQIYKVPIGQPVKNRWDNTVSDGGGIPGFVFNAPLTIGSYRYYVSSEQITIDYLQPMTLKTI